jgi:hypothetical protein
MMAQASRQAIGLTTMFSNPAAVPERRGAIWLGDPIGGWVPLPKLKTIARRLVDVFDHNSVDLIGNGIGACPELDALASYCRDIGLATTIVFEPGSIALDRGYEPAGRRWSLADDQRRPDAESAEPQNVFQQVRALRGETTRKALTAAERVINQLSVRVAGPSADRPVVWVYGSTAIGLDIIDAIKAHRWLAKAVDIGGFLSSAGQCKANVLHGYPWRSADGLLTARADFIVVASETSRLPIQEELSCLNLLDRMIPAYGMAATGAVYERDPEGPGQAFIAGSSANEYAMRELVARTSGDYRSATMTPTAEDSAIGAAA